jgi:CDP-6-deoxy-D-xylo-4-hexulose-3-dehydrase
MLFGGNLVRQPAFVHLRAEDSSSMRIQGELSSADRIMNQTFFLGTYPGLTGEQIQFMVSVIRNFITSKLV